MSTRAVVYTISACRQKPATRESGMAVLWTVGHAEHQNSTQLTETLSVRGSFECVIQKPPSFIYMISVTFENTPYFTQTFFFPPSLIMRSGEKGCVMKLGCRNRKFRQFVKTMSVCTSYIGDLKNRGTFAQ